MKFTHLNEDGAACMMDVTAKNPTVRQASAVCHVDCSPEVMQALRDGAVPEGDVLAMTRVAGISVAKRVPGLLPFARTIGVHGCAMDLSLEDDHAMVCAAMHAVDHMGVEMEVLTSVTVTALAVAGMVKDVDRSAHIRGTKIVAKSNGRSGDWVHPEDPQA